MSENDNEPEPEPEKKETTKKEEYATVDDVVKVLKEKEKELAQKLANEETKKVVKDTMVNLVKGILESIGLALDANREIIKVLNESLQTAIKEMDLVKKEHETTGKNESKEE